MIHFKGKMIHLIFQFYDTDELRRWSIIQMEFVRFPNSGDEDHWVGNFHVEEGHNLQIDDTYGHEQDTPSNGKS